MYDYCEEIPTVQKYNELRELVGWGALDPFIVEKALPKSVYAVIARHKGEVVAFARIVGDGGLCFHIQEIVVHPDHQKQGIARTFMEYIFKYLEKNAARRSYVSVFVGRGLENFYKQYGFWERPTNVMGSGMMQFWNDEEFNTRFRGLPISRPS